MDDKYTENDMRDALNEIREWIGWNKKESEVVK